MKLYLLTLVLCALLVGACKDASLYPIDPQTPPADTVKDTTNPTGGIPPTQTRPLTTGQWELTAFEYANGSVEVPALEGYTIRFTGPTVAEGDGDCGQQFVASYSWDQNTGAVDISVVYWTGPECATPSQQSMYVNGLNDGTVMKLLGDDLWIYYNNGTRRLHLTRTADGGIGERRFNGRILFNTPATIPPDARVLVGWLVEGDNTYVVNGSGTINRADNTFQVTVPDPPPSSVVNYMDLACGVVFITTDPTIGTGSVIPFSFNHAKYIGVSTTYAIFYRPTDVQHVRKWPWLSGFPQGYSVALGRYVKPAGGITAWELVGPAMAKLDVVVDDPVNLDFIGLN